MYILYEVNFDAFTISFQEKPKPNLTKKKAVI